MSRVANEELENVNCHCSSGGDASRKSKQDGYGNSSPEESGLARLFDPEILKRAIKESFVKLNPRMVAKNPVMFVVEVGAALTTIFVIKDAITGAGGLSFWHSNRAVAVVHRAVRQFRRSHGGSARQGAGRRSAQDQDRHDGAEDSAERQVRNGTGFEVARRRRRATAKRVISFPETAKSLKASPASMNP